ncbi:MAG: hypothetical protein AAFX81_14090 [Pseudomonadota bacterium]
MKERQRAARQKLRARQAERSEQEAQARAARFRKGVGGLWDWVSGKARKIRTQNETEAAASQKRDAQEREAMIAGQISVRRGLQRDLRASQRNSARDRDSLRKDVAFYIGMASEPVTADAAVQRKRRGRREDRDFSM